MRFQNFLFILIFSIVFTGCSSCEQTPVKENNSNNTNINAPVNSNSNVTIDQTNVNTNANTGNPLESDMEKVDPLKEKVQAVTLKPVFDAYCDAMRKKDDAGLRKVFSKESLRSIEADMKADGITTISEFLENEPIGNKCELVNENIQGNAGEATVITETYPDGTSIKFVKENNEWKMTNQSAEFDRVDNR